jgi:hypothetical protein
VNIFAFFCTLGLACAVRVVMAGGARARARVLAAAIVLVRAGT